MLQAFPLHLHSTGECGMALRLAVYRNIAYWYEPLNVLNVLVKESWISKSKTDLHKPGPQSPMDMFDWDDIVERAVIIGTNKE